MTRKPTKALEGEIRPTVNFGNRGSVADYVTSAFVGSKQESFYLQASGAYRDSDGFFMSRKYDPVTVGGAVIEDGGRRDFSSVNEGSATIPSRVGDDEKPIYAQVVPTPDAQLPVPAGKTPEQDKAMWEGE